MPDDNQRLSAEAVATALDQLPGWELEADKKLHKVFKFTSFAQAIGWMVSVAIEADQLDHHPNWSNVYNRVEVELWTHSLDGISELDFQLARKMEMLA